VGKLDTERGGEEGELPPDDPAEAPQGMVSAFTCPDCGGSLWKVDDYGVERYRCRVGHLFSDDGLLLGKQEALEAAVWAAMVALEEKADVCRRIARRLTAGGHAERSEKYWNEAAAAEEHLRWLKGTLEQMIVTFPEVYEERDA
jgi:two-component system chemotaxis response regulator CheB